MVPPLEILESNLPQRDRYEERISVLVVDDDEGYAAVVRTALERTDGAIEVTTVSDGRSALQAIEDSPVDCIVSDYAMPGMDGIELAERVASEHPELPFILLTGLGDEETASRAVRAGVDDYVCKSSDALGELARRIRTSVGDRLADSIYHAAWQNATVGLAIHDPETGAFLDVNDRYCEMLGYSREELLGASVGDVSSGADSFTPQRARERVQEVVDGGQTTFEWLDETKAGDRLWVHVTLQPAEIGGRQRVLATVRDVTRRHDREAALRSMYETIADRELGFEAKVERLMSLGRQVLGTGFATLSRIEGDQYAFEFVQSPSGEIQPGEIVSIDDTLCKETVLNKGRLVVDDPLEANSRTRGKALELSCYVGAPVYVGDEVQGTFCFYDVEPREGPFSDWGITMVDLMSRWISAEMERVRIHAELERENERLEDFASIVSHDLRNPLTVATGHVGRLRDEFEHESIGETLTALERISEIVDDVLTWARTGTAVDEPRPVLIATAAEAAWNLVDHPGAQLAIETQQTIQADDGRLRQLLENLFRNAVEHGGPGVRVTVRDLDHGFSVEDDGPGFPDGAGSEIFQSGYSTASDGTGFGLAIVEQIAEAHGWTLEATAASTGGAGIEVHDVEPAPGADASRDER